MVERLIANIGQLSESEFRSGKRDELFAFRAADLVSGFFQAGPYGARIKADDTKINRLLPNRYVANRTRFWIIVRAHAVAGEVDHDLVEIAAGRADVIILDSLGHVDNLHTLRRFDFIDVKECQDQVQAERSGARHAAAGNVAAENSIEPSCQFKSLAL